MGLRAAVCAALRARGAADMLLWRTATCVPTTVLRIASLHDSASYRAPKTPRRTAPPKYVEQTASRVATATRRPRNVEETSDFVDPAADIPEVDIDDDEIDVLDHLNDDELQSNSTKNRLLDKQHVDIRNNDLENDTKIDHPFQGFVDTSQFIFSKDQKVMTMLEATTAARDSITIPQIPLPNSTVMQDYPVLVAVLFRRQETPDISLFTLAFRFSNEQPHKLVFPFTSPSNRTSEDTGLPSGYEVEHVIVLGCSMSSFTQLEATHVNTSHDSLVGTLRSAMIVYKSLWTALPDINSLPNESELNSIPQQESSSVAVQSSTQPSIPLDNRFIIDASDLNFWILRDGTAAFAETTILKACEFIHEKREGDEALKTDTLPADLKQFGSSVFEMDMLTPWMLYEFRNSLSKDTELNAGFKFVSDMVIRSLSFTIWASLATADDIEVSGSMFEKKRIVSTRELLSEVTLRKLDNGDSVLCFRSGKILSGLRYLSGQLVSSLAVKWTKRTRLTKHALLHRRVQQELLFKAFLDDVEQIYTKCLTIMKAASTERANDFKKIKSTISAIKKVFKASTRSPEPIMLDNPELKPIWESIPKSSFAYFCDYINSRLEDGSFNSFKADLFENQEKVLVMSRTMKANAKFDNRITTDTISVEHVPIPPEIAEAFSTVLCTHVASRFHRSPLKEIGINSSINSFEEDIQRLYNPEKELLFKDLSSRLDLKPQQEVSSKLFFKALEESLKFVEKTNAIRKYSMEGILMPEIVNWVNALSEPAAMRVVNDYLLELLKERKPFKKGIDPYAFFATLKIISQSEMYKPVTNDPLIMRSTWKEDDRSGAEQNAGDFLLHTPIAILPSGAIPRGAHKPSKVSRRKGTKKSIESILSSAQRQLELLSLKLSPEVLRKNWETVLEIVHSQEVTDFVDIVGNFDAYKKYSEEVDLIDQKVEELEHVIGLLQNEIPNLLTQRKVMFNDKNYTEEELEQKYAELNASPEGQQKLFEDYDETWDVEYGPIEFRFSALDTMEHQETYDEDEDVLDHTYKEKLYVLDPERRSSIMYHPSAQVIMRYPQLYEGKEKSLFEIDNIIAAFQEQAESTNKEVLLLLQKKAEIKSAMFKIEQEGFSDKQVHLQNPEEIILGWKEAYSVRRTEFKPEFSWRYRREVFRRRIRPRIETIVRHQRGGTLKSLSYRRQHAIARELMKLVVNDKLAEEGKHPRHFAHNMVKIPQRYRARDRVKVAFRSKIARRKRSRKKIAAPSNIYEASGLINKSAPKVFPTRDSAKQVLVARRKLPDDERSRKKIVDFYKNKAKKQPMVWVPLKIRRKLREIFRLKRRLHETPWVIKTSIPLIAIPWAGIRFRGDVAESVAYEEPYLRPINLHNHGDYPRSKPRSESSYLGGGLLARNQIYYHNRCPSCQGNIHAVVSKPALLAGTVVILCPDCKMPHKASDYLDWYSFKGRQGIRKDIKVFDSIFEPILYENHNYGSGYEVEVSRFKYFDESIANIRATTEMIFNRYEAGKGTMTHFKKQEDASIAQFIRLLTNKGIGNYKTTDEYRQYLFEKFAGENLELVAGHRANDKTLSLRQFIDYQDGLHSSESNADPNVGSRLSPPQGYSNYITDISAESSTKRHWTRQVDKITGYVYFVDEKGKPDFLIHDERRKLDLKAQEILRRRAEEERARNMPRFITRKRKNLTTLVNAAIEAPEGYLAEYQTDGYVRPKEPVDDIVVISETIDQMELLEKVNTEIAQQQEERKRNMRVIVESMQPYDFADFKKTTMSDTDFPPGAYRDRLLARARRWNHEFLEWRREHIAQKLETEYQPNPVLKVNLTGNKDIDDILSLDPGDIQFYRIDNWRIKYEQSMHQIIFLDAKSLKQIKGKTREFGPSTFGNFSKDEIDSRTVGDVMAEIDKEVEKWTLDLMKEELKRYNDTNLGLTAYEAALYEEQLNKGKVSPISDLDPISFMTVKEKETLDKKIRTIFKSFSVSKDIATVAYEKRLKEEGDIYDKYLTKLNPLDLRSVEDESLFQDYLTTVPKTKNLAAAITDERFIKQFDSNKIGDFIPKNESKADRGWLNIYSRLFSSKGVFLRMKDGIQVFSDPSTGKDVVVYSSDVERLQRLKGFRRTPEDPEEIEDIGDSRIQHNRLREEQKKSESIPDNDNVRELERLDGPRSGRYKSPWTPSDPLDDSHRDTRALRMARILLDKENFPMETVEDMSRILAELNGDFPLLKEKKTNGVIKNPLTEFNPLGKRISRDAVAQLLNRNSYVANEELTQRESDNAKENGLNTQGKVTFYEGSKPFAKLKLSSEEREKYDKLLEEMVESSYRILNDLAEAKQTEYETLFLTAMHSIPDVEYAGFTAPFTTGSNEAEEYYGTPPSWPTRVAELKKPPFYGTNLAIDAIDDEKFKLYLEREGLGKRVTHNFYLEEYHDMTETKYSPISCPDEDYWFENEEQMGEIMEESRFSDTTLRRKREYFRRLQSYEAQMFGQGTTKATLDSHDMLGNFRENAHAAVKRRAREICDELVNKLADADDIRIRNDTIRKLKVNYSPYIVDNYFKDLEEGDISITPGDRRRRFKRAETSRQAMERETQIIKQIMDKKIYDHFYLTRLFGEDPQKYLEYRKILEADKMEENKEIIKKRYELLGGAEGEKRREEFAERFEAETREAVWNSAKRSKALMRAARRKTEMYTKT